MAAKRPFPLSMKTGFGDIPFGGDSTVRKDIDYACNPLLDRDTTREQKCPGCETEFKIEGGDQMEYRKHLMECRHVKKKYVPIPTLFWEFVACMRANAGKLNGMEDTLSLAHALDRRPDLSWKGRIQKKKPAAPVFKTPTKRLKDEDGGDDERKRVRKSTPSKPKVEKSEMTTLLEMAEISGAVFSCDEDQGIQATKVDKKKGMLVGLPEKLRRFHTSLRNAEQSKSIPGRAEGSGLWQWPNDAPLQKLIPLFMKESIFQSMRSRCKWYCETGPTGSHICMSGMGSLTPLILKEGDVMQMMHYIPESRELLSRETSSCAEMAKKIEEAPKGRWFFIAGKIPDDFGDLLPALAELGLAVTLNPEHLYFIAVGMKSSTLYPWIDFSLSWHSGAGRISMTQIMHKLAHDSKHDLDPLPTDEETRREKCRNCRRARFVPK